PLTQRSTVRLRGFRLVAKNSGKGLETDIYGAIPVKQILNQSKSKFYNSANVTLKSDPRQCQFYWKRS
ncbi:MAG: hypothetical protein WCO45_09385, partial [Pseudanabaena sp. ELA607]